MLLIPAPLIHLDFNEVDLLPWIDLRGKQSKPARLDDYEVDLTAYALSIVEDVDQSIDPSSYTEAVSSPDSSKWLLAMNEEIESLYW